MFSSKLSQSFLFIYRQFLIPYDSMLPNLIFIYISQRETLLSYITQEVAQEEVHMTTVPYYKGQIVQQEASMHKSLYTLLSLFLYTYL